MANSILPQTASFCKVQNNPKMTALAKVYSKSDNQYLRECARIMTMSNDDAVEFLKSIGFSQIIPGTHFAPMYDYAAFFGVKEDSLYAYLQRHGLNRTDNPREAFSSDLRSFFRRAGLLNFGKFVEGERMKPGGFFYFHFENTNTHYVTEYRWSTRFYSARVALCVIPLMYNWNRKHDAEHKCVGIYEKLMEFVGQVEARELAAKTAKRKEPVAQSSSGTTISKDELFGMIKQAVREVLEDTKVEVPATFTITT